jgi:predicted RecB family nuclease
LTLRTRTDKEQLTEIATRHGGEGTRQSAAETLDAMREGADIVFQAVLADGDWLGHIDFLRKLDDVDSDLGPWSYEAVDMKLARHVKPYFVVQLAPYSELLARAQGREPEHIEIVLGNWESERLRLRDFDAYVRRLRGRFLEHVARALPAIAIGHAVRYEAGEVVRVNRLHPDTAGSSKTGRLAIFASIRSRSQ